MAVAFVAAGNLAGNATQASQDIVAPSCSANDILIAALINKSAVTNVISPPDGTWTQITQDNNDCTTAADDHRYALFWKRAAGADSGATFTFTKATDDNVLFAGVISAWSGCATSGSPLDSTAVGTTKTVGAADNVSFPAFDPTCVAAHICYFAFYGNDATTFSAAMSADTNPDCTVRFDLETSTGNDASIACISGDTTDGSNIAARTWASNSTTDAGNTGVVFGLKPNIPVSGSSAIKDKITLAGTALRGIIGTGAAAIALSLAGSATMTVPPITSSGSIAVNLSTQGYGSNGFGYSPHIWLDPNRENYSDDDDVTRANDWSGNDRDALPDNAAPFYKTNIVNGKPVFRFELGSDLVFGDVLSGLTSAEVFVVFKVPTSTSSNQMWTMGSEGTLNDLLPHTTGEFFDSFGSTARKSTGVPASSPASFIIYNVISKSGEWTSRINGTQHFTTATNTVGWTTQPFLGKDVNGNRTANLDIAEFIVVGRELTTDERSDTVTYLSEKYAIDLTNDISSSGSVAVRLVPSGSALAGNIGSGSSAIALSLAGSGKQHHAGSGTIAINLTLAGSGSLNYLSSGTVPVGLSLAGSATMTPASGGSGDVRISEDSQDRITEDANDERVTEDFVAGSNDITSAGSLAVSLRLSGTAQQQHTSSGTIAVSLAPSGTALRGIISSGTIAVSLVPSGTASLQYLSSGTIAVSLVPSGTASLQYTGTGSSAISLSLAGTVSQSISTSGSSAIALRLSGTAQQQHSSSGTIAVSLTPSGTALAGITSSGSVAVSLVPSGTAQQRHTGSGTIAIPLSLSGTGTVLAAGTGAGSSAITLTLSGTAQQQHSSSGTIALSLAPSGAASLQFIGTGSTAVSLSLAGTGTHQQQVTSSGTIAVSLSLAGTGTRTPPVATGTGKYQPEHDSALIDLESANDFTAEHQSAVTDIEQANTDGFASEHASALKDLFDAGV